VAFEPLTIGTRHLVPDVAVDQLVLNRPYLVELIPVRQQLLFKCRLI
jgi:hypothetical protein